jgi:hypothetical protein
VTADLQRVAKNKRSKRNTKKISSDPTVEKKGPARPSGRSPRITRRKRKNKRKRKRVKNSPEREARNAAGVETKKDPLPTQESPKLESHSLSKAKRSVRRKEQE